MTPALDNPSAAVAILHARAPEESILLIRRTTRASDPWSGHWSFPGGKRDNGDADLLDTALRELAEECGIELRRRDVSHELPLALAGRRVGRFVVVAPFVFDVPCTLPTRLDPEEAVESLWAPVQLLADTALHRRQCVPGLPDDMLFPALDLNGVPLWGFTYRLVCEWLRVPMPEDG